MSAPAPHFLLFSESNPCRRLAHTTAEGGHWRFVLESVDGQEKFAAADREQDACGDRLELLAVVRGLEALDQPSRVTLITPSRYVARGIRYSLAEWRASGWQWECYGKMTPIKNKDLWCRIDQALKFHHVECRQWRMDEQGWEEYGDPQNKVEIRQGRLRRESLQRQPARTTPCSSQPTGDRRLRIDWAHNRGGGAASDGAATHRGRLSTTLLQCARKWIRRMSLAAA